jgi:hypothetical protein
MTSSLTMRPQIDGRDMTDDELKAAGFRKVEMYVIDSDAPDFAEQCRLASEAARIFHKNHPEEMEFLEALFKEHWRDEEI